MQIGVNVPNFGPGTDPGRLRDWARTGAIARSGLGKVVYALSGDQLDGLKPSGGFPAVPQEGPALYDEARVPVDGYYV